MDCNLDVSQLGRITDMVNKSSSRHIDKESLSAEKRRKYNIFTLLIKFELWILLVSSYCISL